MSDDPSEPPLTPPIGSATFRALRHRNYRLYFFGQLISLTGSWMQGTALAALAYELTGKSRWPALISTAQILPTFLFGAWGGSLADRWPKRPLLLWTQGALLVLALLLTLVVLGDPVPWQLLAVTAAAGLVQAIDLPARMAFVMDMVGRDDLINAVALNSVLFNCARVVGPALGVLVLHAVGPAACFLANALSYVAVLWALAAMDVDGSAGVAEERKGLRILFEGFTELAQRPALLFLVAASGITALCGWPFLVLLPALADHPLEQPRNGYGIMVSATGLGALTAALLVATFGTWERQRWFLTAGVMILSAALIGLSLAGTLLPATVCCALAGLGLILFFSTGQAVLQLSAEAHNRGRLLGVWAMVLSGAVPLGNLLAGEAADRWNVPVVLRTEGVVCGSAALGLLLGCWWWQSRSTAKG